MSKESIFRKKDPRPTYWQAAPCPACGTKSWAVPWEPQAACLNCNGPLQVVAVYLPTNPEGSQFGRPDRTV